MSTHINTDFVEAKENNFVEEEKQEYVLPHTLELKRPIKIGDKEIKELVFSYYPTIEHVRHLPVDPSKQMMGHYVPGVAGMVGQPTAIINKLGITDFSRCVEVFNYFC